MEIYVFELATPKFTLFCLDDLDLFKLVDVDKCNHNDIYKYIHDKYIVTQTAHRYTHSIHMYSACDVELDGVKTLLFFTTSDNPEFNDIKTSIRQRTINQIIE